MSERQWQPIETAPRDGTEVLVWDGFNQMVSWWHEPHGEWGTLALCAEQPTHWMPLPASPALAATEALDHSADEPCPSCGGDMNGAYGSCDSCRMKARGWTDVITTRRDGGGAP